MAFLFQSSTSIEYRESRILIVLSLLSVLGLCVSCSKKPDTGEDDKVTTLGSIEVTAVEVPRIVDLDRPSDLDDANRWLALQERED